MGDLKKAILQIFSDAGTGQMNAKTVYTMLLRKGYRDVTLEQVEQAFKNLVSESKLEASYPITSLGMASVPYHCYGRSE